MSANIQKNKSNKVVTSTADNDVDSEYGDSVIPVKTFKVLMNKNHLAYNQCYKEAVDLGAKLKLERKLRPMYEEGIKKLKHKNEVLEHENKLLKDKGKISPNTDIILKKFNEKSYEVIENMSKLIDDHYKQTYEEEEKKEIKRLKELFEI